MPSPMILTLELHPDSEPISGSIHDGRGEQRLFQGWMEFALALDLFIRGPDERHSFRDAGPTPTTRGEVPQ